MRGHTWFLLTILCLATLLAGASTDARAARLVATTVIDAREPVQQPVVDWLAEADSPYSIDDLLSGAGAANWQSIPSTETSFGYTTTPYWFRLTLRNPHDTPSERYLVIPLPYMDDIRVWQTDGERIISEVMLGERLPYDARLIDHPFFIIPITLPPQTAHTWLFRLQTQGSMEFPIEVWQPQAFWEAQTRYQQGLALFYGFLLLGLTLTVLLWARLRESLYGFYILFLASALLLMAAQHGHTFRYLWPTHPDIQNLILFWAVPLCTIGAIEFSRRFLRLRKHVRPFDKLLAGLTWLNVAHLGLVPVLPASWVLQQAVLLGMLASVLLAIAGPLVLMHRQPGALSYNIGWLFLETSVLINGLQKFGWLPANHFTLYALLYGIGAQSALLTFGLVDRLYRERTRRIRAEQANVRLEQERAQAAENLLHSATHDPVTGLPNRSILVEALQRKIDEGEPVGILLVRFNRLRDIDRTLGQAHADVVVKMAAERLRNESILLPDTQPLTGQNGETIARLNGSTFALLYNPRVVGDMTLHIGPVLRHLSQKLPYQNMPLDLDPRIGLAQSPDHDCEATNLLRKAQIAVDMTQRTQPMSSYRPDADPYSPKRLALLGELDEAIRSEQLQLHLQPQQDLHTGAITTFEALVRWVHPRHGSIPPLEFIGLAEETGLIHALTRWVVHEAICLLSDLERDGYPDTRIAVNISAKDLSAPDFVDTVLGALAEQAQPASRLILEITETAIMEDPEQAIHTLEQLSSAGITLALDDYGAGYSSLHQIKRLPLHEIKIDRSLIAGINDSTDGRLIIETTVRMCHSLGYKVVAEGIEDDDTLDTLRALRCDLAQGYHIARPMPYAFVLEWLKNTGALQPG